MNRISTIFCVALAIVALSFPSSASAQDQSNAVENGGISVDGWQGRVDPGEAERGQVIENARLSRERGVMHITTGPSVVYWNPENTASGNYTVMATFTEPEFRTLSNHPHPYGLFIGGHDMGTENQTLLYCAAYGNGRFIMRGFGPEPFRVNGERPEENEAIHSAAEVGSSVTQDVAISVTDDAVECAVNGTVVGRYPKADLIGEGKLKSTDGVFGIRFGHNTAGTVSGLHSM